MKGKKKTTIKNTLLSKAVIQIWRRDEEFQRQANAEGVHDPRNWLYVRVCAQLCLTLCDPKDEAPLPMEFSRQECWRELLFPIPGDLPNPEMEPVSLASPALA